MIAKMLSVVAPAYNEEENVDCFMEKMRCVLSSIAESWEIVCVNDGSRDRTLEKLIEWNRRDKRIKAINLSRNFGKEIAMTAGIDFAVGDAVIPIDIDLQDPPELIREMVRLWQEGADVVYATRLRRDGESAAKKITASLFYSTISRITRIHIPRDTGDYRLMDRRVVEALKQLPENQRFMKGLFSWVGYRQVSLPYNREKRFAGKTKFNYWKLWNFAIEGITSFSIVPLQLAAYIGVLTSLLAFLYAVFITGRTLVYGVDVPGYASTMAVMLFLGGVQLIFLGIVGEYIGRIYNEVKRRPLYLIKDVYE